jgi:hypothetical protein
MANYGCALRTNYFHVKDPAAFKKFMKRVIACEDTVELWEETDGDGKPVFGFGCYGSIAGVRPSENASEEDYDYEEDYDEFINGLSEHIADDDAVIILESGNEKLRYLVGSATIITSTQSQYLDISTLAAEAAAQMLGNSSWKTRIEY